MARMPLQAGRALPPLALVPLALLLCALLGVRAAAGAATPLTRQPGGRTAVAAAQFANALLYGEVRAPIQ